MVTQCLRLMLGGMLLVAPSSDGGAPLDVAGILARVAQMAPAEQQQWLRALEGRLERANGVLLEPAAAAKKNAHFHDLFHQPTIPRETLRELLRETGTREQAAMGKLVRQYRIRVFEVFWSERKTYDERLAALDRVLAAWEAAGKPFEQQERLIIWLQGAFDSAAKGAVKPLPPAPTFEPQPTAKPDPSPSPTPKPTPTPKTTPPPDADEPQPNPAERSRRALSPLGLPESADTALAGPQHAGRPLNLRLIHPEAGEESLGATSSVPPEVALRQRVPSPELSSPEPALLSSDRGVRAAESSSPELTGPAQEPVPEPCATASSEAVQHCLPASSGTQVSTPLCLGRLPQVALIESPADDTAPDLLPTGLRQRSIAATAPAGVSALPEAAVGPIGGRPLAPPPGDDLLPPVKARYEAPPPPVQVSVADLKARIAGYNLALRALEADLDQPQPWSAQELRGPLDRLQRLLRRRHDLATFCDLLPEAQRETVGVFESPRPVIAQLARRIFMARTRAGGADFNGTESQRQAELEQLDRLSQELAKLAAEK